MTKPRCVIYCRVSTNKQEEEGTSLETQLAKCEAYAATQGWEVAATFREAASGADLHERKELKRALSILKNAGADILLCYALDRLSRDQNHVGYIVSEMDHLGATLKLVTEDFDSSPMGKFLRAAANMVAEVERIKITERTTRGKRARAENERKLIPGHKPPFGLLWRDADKTRLVPDPATAPLLVRMFTTIANGGSATGVAKAFTLEGIPTPMGLQVPWRQTTVSKILRNPIYTGKAEAFRHKRTKGKGRKRDGSLGKVVKHAFTPESERVLFPEGTAPVLISPTTFAAVQSQLEVNKSQSTRNNRNPEAFLLRAGFAKCGYCGGVLVSHWNIRKGARIGTPMYECSSSSRQSHGCPHYRISAKLLDGEVESRLMMVLEDEAFVRQRIEPQFQENPLPLQVAEVKKAIEDRSKRISKLITSLQILEGAEADETADQIKALGKQRESLKIQLAGLERAKATDDGRKSDLDKLFRTLEIAQRHSEELTYEGKRKWLEALGFEVRVWATGHKPRWEITSSIDPSFWEIGPWETGKEIPEDTPSVWPAAGTGEILEPFVITTSCCSTAGAPTR